MDESDRWLSRFAKEARLGYGDGAFPRYRLARDTLLRIAWEQEMARAS